MVVIYKNYFQPKVLVSLLKLMRTFIHTKDSLCKYLARTVTLFTAFNRHLHKQNTPNILRNASSTKQTRLCTHHEGKAIFKSAGIVAFNNNYGVGIHLSCRNKPNCSFLDGVVQRKLFASLITIFLSLLLLLLLHLSRDAHQRWLQK